MPLRRRRRRLDTTPCEVIVEPGRLVFWQGQQRSGTLYGVPKWQAMRWLRQRFVSIVIEDSPGPAATRVTPARASSGERPLDRSHDAPPPRRPTFADDSDDAEADSARDDKTAGQGDGGETGGRSEPHRYGPGNTDAPITHGFAPQTTQQPIDTAAELGEHPDDGRGEPARTRTQPVPNPYGPGRCANCGSPVTGRRKWCDEACRLQAYRASR
jgi:hypothetical protein